MVCWFYDISYFMLKLFLSFYGGLVGWLVGFYGILAFVGYLTPNPIFM